MLIGSGSCVCMYRYITDALGTTQPRTVYPALFPTTVLYLAMTSERIHQDHEGRPTFLISGRCDNEAGLQLVCLPRSSPSRRNKSEDTRVEKVEILRTSDDAGGKDSVSR